MHIRIKSYKTCKTNSSNDNKHQKSNQWKALWFFHSGANDCQKRYCNNFLFVHLNCWSFCYLWRLQRSDFWEIKQKKVKMLISLFQGIIYSMKCWTKWPLFTLQRLKLCAIYMSKSPKKHEHCLLKEKKRSDGNMTVFSSSSKRVSFKIVTRLLLIFSVSFFSGIIWFCEMKLPSCWFLHQHEHCYFIKL